jgi:hypothetical protein
VPTLPWLACGSASGRTRLGSGATVVLGTWSFVGRGYGDNDSADLAYLTEVEAAKLKGAWVDPAHGRVRFLAWFEEWWATTVNLRPKTRTRNEMVFRLYVLPRCGAVPLDAISQREVRAWGHLADRPRPVAGHRVQGVPALRQGDGGRRRRRDAGGDAVPGRAAAQGRA